MDIMIGRALIRETENVRPHSLENGETIFCFQFSDIKENYPPLLSKPNEGPNDRTGHFSCCKWARGWYSSPSANVISHNVMFHFGFKKFL